MSKHNLISTDQLAREMRRSPETVRRLARRNEIPSVKDGSGDYKFDRVAVFETFVKKDVINSLSNILDDPALPALIRKNISTMRDGVEAGWLSVEDVGRLMGAS